MASCTTGPQVLAGQAWTKHPHLQKGVSSLHAFRKCAQFNACLPQQHLNFVRVPFWVKHKIFSSHPPTLMRKVEAPLWDLGIGSRHSDMRRAIRIDIDAGSDFISGFVELTVQEPKQSRAARRKRLMLPVVAPLMGIGDRPWGSAWQAARKHWKLGHTGNIDLAADGTLLPSCCMSTSRASSWLRTLLSRDDRTNADSLLSITTHSLKATLLSWSAKASMDTLERTILGYHSTGVSSSALSYSRDAMAGPLRSLQNLLRQVRMKKFNPDDTRSGRWAVSSSSGSSSDPGSASSTSSEAEETEQVVQGASHLFATLASSQVSTPLCRTRLQACTMCSNRAETGCFVEELFLGHWWQPPC